MMELFTTFLKLLIFNPFTTAFWLGLLTPVTAACVIPLYPGFLSYVSGQFSGGEERSTVFLFGLVTVTGVISSMMITGIIVSTVLEVSFSRTIGIITPVIMSILGFVGLGLLLDFNIGSIMPEGNIPRFENPFMNAFGFGFFFGGAVLPCNPGFIAVLFARSTLFETPTTNFLRFFSFGLGMGAPLLIFSLISGEWSKKIIGWLNKYSTQINRLTGLILISVSVYYLSCQFGIIPLPGEACVYLTSILP